MAESPHSHGSLFRRLTHLPLQNDLALVFPGQGSQKPGMGAAVRESSALASLVFEAADLAAGLSLTDLCASADADTLTRTDNAQPAILTTSLAILAAAIENGALTGRPAFVAGHSLGEYTALVAAGSLTLEDGVRLVRERGRLMHEAGQARSGTLAAIVGLTDDAVQAICEDAGAEVANYNAPTQTVIGGTNEAVRAACDLARERGGRGLPVNVSGAFHTSLMGPVSERFAAALDSVQIADPAMPVAGNVEARLLTTAAEVRRDLARQIASPVRWYQSLDLLRDSGVTRVIEIGPGRILTGQMKRSHPELTAEPLDEAEAIKGTSLV
jgi:[acyl-carrier-protein] S-malonyltransferase